MDRKPPGAGKSSYDLVDADVLFKRLALTAGTVFLDLACGSGQYSLKAAESVGKQGIVYAIDLWPEGVAELLTRIARQKIPNIWTTVGDVGGRIPLPDGSIDAALMATVLHDFRQSGIEQRVLRETARLIRPGGVLVIVEFKKEKAGPPGPPESIRIDEQQVEAIVTPHGFSRSHTDDLGHHTYGCRFVAANRPGSE